MRVHVAGIEERFLPAQADAFAGSEREEKASACSVRNDRIGWESSRELGQGFVLRDGERWVAWSLNPHPDESRVGHPTSVLALRLELAVGSGYFAEKGAEFCGGFFAGAGFDAAGYVDRVGVDGEDGFSYVFGGKAAG